MITGGMKMSRQKARIGMSEISETEIKSMTKEQNYFRGYFDGKSDTLDKIREEIAEYGSICVAYVITDKTKTDHKTFYSH